MLTMCVLALTIPALCVLESLLCGGDWCAPGQTFDSPDSAQWRDCPGGLQMAENNPF